MSEMTALSPLAEIEANVQLRAKKLEMDVDRATGRDLLRTLVREEVSRWSDDYKRGLRSFDLSDPELVSERALRNVAGYGPLEPLLADDDVWEIMINAPDTSMAESTHCSSREPRLRCTCLLASRRGMQTGLVVPSSMGRGHIAAACEKDPCPKNAPLVVSY